MLCTRFDCCMVAAYKQPPCNNQNVQQSRLVLHVHLLILYYVHAILNTCMCVHTYTDIIAKLHVLLLILHNSRSNPTRHVCVVCVCVCVCHSLQYKPSKDVFNAAQSGAIVWYQIQVSHEFKYLLEQLKF